MLTKKIKHAEKSKSTALLPDRLRRLFRQARPLDITVEAGSASVEEIPADEQEQRPIPTSLLPADGSELESVITTDLVSGRNLSRRPKSVRLRFIRIAVAILIPGLIIAALILVPAWQNRLASHLKLQVVFSDSQLGKLALSSWSDDTIQQEIYSGFGPPSYYGNVCYAKSLESGVCGEQHLSFVDTLGNIYSWNKSTGVLTKETNPRPVSTDQSMPGWNWLYPGQYILEHLKSSTGSSIYQIRDVIRNRLLYTGNTPLVSLASDGRWIAAYGGKQQIQIIDGLYGEGVPHTLSSPYFAHLVALSWSPDTTEMATASADGTIQLWDVFHGTLLDTWSDLAGIAPTARSNDKVLVAWSPSGQKLATASILNGVNQPVHIWNTTTAELVVGYNGQSTPLTSLSWLDSGLEILSSSANEADLWNASNGQTLARLNAQQIAADPSYYTSPVVLNEPLLAVPSGPSMQVLDMRTGKLLQTLSNEESNNAFIATSWNPSIQTYPVAVDKSGDLLIWQMHPWQVAAHYQLPCSFTSQSTAASINLSWSPDGNFLAVDCGSQGLVVLEISA